ncbi:sucrose:sucrose 1-fructosyltransferase-like [Lolium rigidum]|uniref:sucrose:sucrose 1-fructosyltransferase-like n=1 Tax=Lolium rigidum TaxID=89674 RepID=UPI001F5CC78E|nr:sucrose:sucrose 1-fructosyltransferase-like [Lolium rigidum]
MTLLGGIGEDAGADADGFPWSNAMLEWQRTGYHFQPKKNYMNDPSGPMYYRGWYHLFYQHNPKGAVKGDIIAWGHAVSRDLVRWRHLPLAMVPDHWYDIKGAMTGSTTVLPDGKVVLLYSGNSNTSEQVQCLAVPANPRDPLLRRWTKHPANPILRAPPGIGIKDFRDPTTAWFDKSDRTWRTVIGSKDDHGHAGIAMTYKTKDFLRYELIPGYLHRVNGSGMWECVDFYPIGGNGKNSSEGMLYVMKESSDDDRHDYYALGRYNAKANRWTPLDPKADLGHGLRYDWGMFYASKTFYDPAKRRRVLWGWVREADSKQTDITKGWGSVQSIPRTVALDEKTRTNLLQWPVEEVETLRLNSTHLSGIIIDAGSIFSINLRQAAQLDIEASFRLDASVVGALDKAEGGYNCSTSGGAANRGALGPFGLLVHANEHHSEQMAAYFYVSRGLDGGLQTHFCHDESRSSRARSVVKRVVGSTVPMLNGEALSVRILVDHSIVESFAMGGRLAVTSRVYPSEAIYAKAGVYVFNNATSFSVAVEKLVVHEMDSSKKHVRD